jgi:hypothetical protein
MAEKARNHIKYGFFVDGEWSDPQLLTKTEALADLLQDHGIQNYDVKYNYKELKRKLFVYLANQPSGAINNARPRTERQTGALLEVEIPKDLLRLSFNLYRGSTQVIEVAKEVSLKYLQQVFVSKENFQRAVNLLDKFDLTGVRVGELEEL